MAGAKPRLFVGSASEAKPFVENLCSALTDFCQVHPWYSSPAFMNMESTLSDLLAATTLYDLGLFILTADDITISRRRKTHSIRDNVLFELGLFLGALGPARTIGLMEELEEKRLKVPSDLSGINLPQFTYSDHDSIVDATTKVLPAIRRKVEKQGLRHGFPSLRGEWDFEKSTGTFWFETDPVKVHQSRELIVGQGLVLVIRKRDPRKAEDSDPAIVIGTVREVSTHDTRPIRVTAGSKGCLGRLRASDAVEGYLLLVPSGVNVHRMKSLREMYRAGCRRLDSVGRGVG